MSKTRGYCFTINNYIDDDLSDVTDLCDMATYLVCGKEVGENETPHLQGYVHFKNPISFSSIKKKLPRAHIEVAKGSAVDNRVYCTKDGNIFIEYGKIPKPGARTDCENTVEGLKNGDNMRAVIEKATSYQSIKVAEIWLKYNEEPRDFKPEVRWYHGSTGSGKSKAAIEWLGEGYYQPVSFKWWEGYDAHENVLLDEVRGDFCKFNEMLRLLDRYQYRVECKGGSRQLLAKKIAITSPYHPDKVWSTVEDKQQLFRRLDEIIALGEPVEVYVRRIPDFDELGD